MPTALDDFKKATGENPVDVFKRTSQDSPVDVFKRTASDLSSFGVKPQPKIPLFQPKNTGEEVIAQGISRAVDTALFGIPDFVAKQMGYEIPQPTTPAGGIAAGVGELAGFIGGGPIKVGSKVSAKLANKVLSNPTLLKSTGLTMGKHAISLGVASGLMTPEEGFFSPIERLKQFGSGAIQGVVFGGLSFIPSTPARMVSNAAVFGVPSSLAHEPIEMQVFNYGLGAFFGRKGLSAKSELEKQQKLSEIVKKGMDIKEVKPFLKENQELLNNFQKDVMTQGKEPFTPEQRINEIVGKNVSNVYRFNEKGMFEFGLGKQANLEERKNLTMSVRNLINKFESKPNSDLRFDDVDWILSNYGTKKSLNKLTDIQLTALEKVMLNPPKAPSEKIYRPNIPRLINPYDKISRPNYSVLEKTGFGDRWRNGLVSKLLSDDINTSIMMSNHSKLADNWKRAVGFQKSTSRNIGAYLDGKISKNQLIKFHGEKSFIVADQIRQYFDTLLDAVNRQRAKYNQPLIEKRKNYLTHIFENLQKEKGTLPFELEQAIDFITTQRRRFQYEIKRKGDQQGYIMDTWQILDIYANRAALAINDDFIRMASRYKKFLVKERKLRTSKNQVFDYDVEDLISNVDSTIKELTGRPGKLDRSINNWMNMWNRWMVNLGFENLQMNSVQKISNFYTSAIYGTQMGFRPKLAIRNLGQHMLAIGQTGYKPLVKALTAKRTPELLNIISKSRVVQSRAASFAPESETFNKFIKSGMWMFQKADMKNVVDSYLAGYFQAKSKGLSEKNAVIRGDEVAGLTQFLYLNGNRNGLSRGLGLSRTLRPMSVFTTWPTNYIEFLISSSKPEHRANLMKYLATSTGFIGITALAGIKGIQYTGLNSPATLLNWVTTGQLPISGVAQKTGNVQIINDIKKVLKDDGDLTQLLFYTFEDSK